MFEQYENIVNQYFIQVQDFHKGRGAILLDTDMGLKILKEVQLREDKINFINEIQKDLTEQGFLLDCLEFTKEGQLFVVYDEKTYVLKDWTEGREIYFNDKNEVVLAAKHLAKMHKCMQKPIENSRYIKFDKTNTYLDSIIRHNKELVRIRNSIKRMSSWSEFELLYLETFEYYYSEAKKATYEIGRIYEEAKKLYQQEKVVVHGQYNHHNLIIDQLGQLHIYNFEYAAYHLPIMDLYGMLRKILEKNDWDLKLGMEVIEAYTKIFSLSKYEIELMIHMLNYPEKFWKVSNYYFNLNKAWKPKQTLVKLKKLIIQEEKKQYFTDNLMKIFQIKR